MSEEPQVAHKIGEGEPEGQLPERRRETHGRLIASFLATNAAAKLSLPAAALDGAANAVNQASGAWTVQQYDQARGVYGDRVTTDDVAEAHEMFQRGPEFRVLDNALNDFAADYQNGRPIYHGRSLFHTKLRSELQTNVNVLSSREEDKASLPWLVVPTQADQGETLTIQDRDGNTIARTFGAEARDHRDARRIVACVNACVGVPTPALAWRRFADEMFGTGARAQNGHDESAIDPAGALTAALLRASQAVDLTVLNDGIRRAGNCRYCVDGAVFPEDRDGPLYQADGTYAPFVVFDVERQQNLPGHYETRGAAEAALVALVVQEAVNTIAAAGLTLAQRPAASMNLQAGDCEAQESLGDSAQANNDEEATGCMRP